MDLILFLPIALQRTLLSTFRVPTAKHYLTCSLTISFSRKVLRRGLTYVFYDLTLVKLTAFYSLLCWFELIGFVSCSPASWTTCLQFDSRQEVHERSFPSWTFHRVLSNFFLSINSVVTCTQELSWISKWIIMKLTIVRVIFTIR